MWQQIAAFETVPVVEWQYSAPTIGDWFRVRYVMASSGWGRVLLGQASTVPRTHYEIKRFYAKSDKTDLYRWKQPSIWAERVICCRIGAWSSATPFSIIIEVWAGYDDPEIPLVQCIDGDYELPTFDEITQ